MRTQFTDPGGRRLDASCRDAGNRGQRSRTGSFSVAHFFEAVAARKEPISDVFSHHRALTTCHLAGIASRVGRKIRWDPKNERVVGDQLAQSLVAREQRQGFEIEM